MAILESTFGLLFEKGENYSKTTIELLKLKLAERSANLVSFLLMGLIVSLFCLLAIFLLSIGLSLFIGDLLGKIWLGFFIVSLLNCAIGYGLYFYRNHFIKAPIISLILKAFGLQN